MAAAQEKMIAQESQKQGNLIKMEEQESVAPKTEKDMEEVDCLPRGRTGQVFSGEYPHLAKQEAEKEVSRIWDAQLQEFLKTLQAPCSRGDGPQLPEPRQRNDSRTSAVSSKCVMEATKWPGGLWASQPQLIPIGDLKQDDEAVCCGNEMERVQTGETVRSELRRQRFRGRCYREVEGPRETCRQLQELCRQWLRPERHTKEQILDLLTLEQFLVVLPTEMQRWVRESNPEDCTQAVTLAEYFLQAQQGAKGRERQIKGSSEVMFVNLLKRRREFPGEAKEQGFMEAEQQVDGSAICSAGDGWLGKNEEELKPFLDSPGEEEPQKVTLETTKEDNSPRGGESAENLCRAERQNGSNNKTVFSGGTYKSLNESTSLQQVNSMKVEAQEESSARCLQLFPRETSQAGEKTYKCWHCGRSFVSSSDLVSHERTHVGEKLYKCAHCGESARTHTGQKPHKCSHCGNTFGSNSQEEIHASEKPYTCPECGKSYTHISYLLKHRRSHTGEKPYKCAVCGKNFTLITGLKAHQKIHIGEKPYKCSHCGKCFIWKSNLMAHERNHAPLCSYCGRSFSQNSDLVKHERTHTANEAFACFACGKTFDVSSELVVHAQIHKENPFKCSFCEKSFRNNMQRIEHQKLHTGEEQHKSSH